MGMTQYAVRALEITKVFTTRRGMPPGANWGGSHWLVDTLLKATSKLEHHTAVDRVTLDVEQGDFIALLGPNGAGKTTLLKTLCTLLEPDGGEAKIGGYDLRTQQTEVRRVVSLIGSGHWVGFDWGLTLYENLEFFASIYNISVVGLRKKITGALELVGLAHKMRETPRTLSSGERQKLLLAKGFLLYTPVFFLDEPTVGLDPVSAANIREYIKKELSRKQGVTIILTTHRMQEAEELSNRIAIMNKGRLIAYDSLSALRRRLGGFRVICVKARGVSDTLVRELSGFYGAGSVSCAITHEGATLWDIRVQVAGDGADLRDIGFKFSSLGADVVEIYEQEPSLEDVFVQLTGGMVTGGL